MIVSGMRVWRNFLERGVRVGDSFWNQKGTLYGFLFVIYI